MKNRSDTAAPTAATPMVLLPVSLAELSDLVSAAVSAELASNGRPPTLLTRSQLAHELSCCAATISNLTREGLPRIMVGSEPRYSLPEVIAWLRAREAREAR